MNTLSEFDYEQEWPEEKRKQHISFRKKTRGKQAVEEIKLHIRWLELPWVYWCGFHEKIKTDDSDASHAFTDIRVLIAEQLKEYSPGVYALKLSKEPNLDSEVWNRTDILSPFRGDVIPVRLNLLRKTKTALRDMKGQNKKFNRSTDEFNAWRAQLQRRYRLAKRAIDTLVGESKVERLLLEAVTLWIGPDRFRCSHQHTDTELTRCIDRAPRNSWSYDFSLILAGQRNCSLSIERTNSSQYQLGKDLQEWPSEVLCRLSRKGIGSREIQSAFEIFRNLRFVEKVSVITELLVHHFWEGSGSILNNEEIAMINRIAESFFADHWRRWQRFQDFIQLLVYQANDGSALLNDLGAQAVISFWRRVEMLTLENLAYIKECFSEFEFSRNEELDSIIRRVFLTIFGYDGLKKLRFSEFYFFDSAEQIEKLILGPALASTVLRKREVIQDIECKVILEMHRLRIHLPLGAVVGWFNTCFSNVIPGKSRLDAFVLALEVLEWNLPLSKCEKTSTKNAIFRFLNERGSLFFEGLASRSGLQRGYLTIEEIRKSNWFVAFRKLSNGYSTNKIQITYDNLVFLMKNQILVSGVDLIVEDQLDLDLYVSLRKRLDLGNHHDRFSRKQGEGLASKIIEFNDPSLIDSFVNVINKLKKISPKVLSDLPVKYLSSFWVDAGEEYHNERRQKFLRTHLFVLRQCVDAIIQMPQEEMVYECEGALKIAYRWWKNGYGNFGQMFATYMEKVHEWANAKRNIHRLFDEESCLIILISFSRGKTSRLFQFLEAKYDSLVDWDQVLEVWNWIWQCKEIRVFLLTFADDVAKLKRVIEWFNQLCLARKIKKVVNLSFFGDWCLGNRGQSKVECNSEFKYLRQELQCLRFNRAIIGKEECYPKRVRKILQWKIRLQREYRFLQEQHRVGKLSYSGLFRFRYLKEVLQDREELNAWVFLDLHKELEQTVPCSKMESLEKLIADAISAYWVEIYGKELPEKIDPNLENALKLRVSVEENRRMLKRILAHENGDGFEWIVQHPLNQAFLAKLKKSDVCVGEWLKPRQYTFRVFDTTLSVYSETSPLRVLQMGNYFGSCLSRNGMYSYSTIANAVEINKKVLYVANGEGKIIGRKLLVVNEHGVVFGFHDYGASSQFFSEKHAKNPRLWIKIIFHLMSREIARSMHGALEGAPDSNHDESESSMVLFAEWYDDCSEPFESWIHWIEGDGFFPTAEVVSAICDRYKLGYFTLNKYEKARFQLWCDWTCEKWD